jgi:PPOX class probable F420-dependent enzyme
MTRASDGYFVDETSRWFLKRQRLAHLATVDASGAPHVVPICFVLVGETVYISIDEKPKKSNDPRRLRRLRNIAANPQVAIVADVYDDADWSRLGFVLLHGVARMVETTADEHAAAIRELRAKYVQYRAMALDDRPLIAADITSVTAWGRLDGQDAEG